MAAGVMRLPAFVIASLWLLLAAAEPSGAVPEGQVTCGVHTTLVPTYFDPAETLIGTSSSPSSRVWAGASRSPGSVSSPDMRSPRRTKT